MRSDVKKALRFICPHPGCMAEPKAKCRGMKTGSVHRVRMTLSRNESLALGANAGFQLAKVIARIATVGRDGPHEDGDSCGCGRCCAMIARGIVAHIEGIVGIVASERQASP